ncbi:MAG: glycosyltransferase, partial [Chthoniobacteraceae bacterium]
MTARVLHIIDSFDLGGGQTALLNLLRALDRQRFDLEVACMHGRGVFWEDFTVLGIPVHSLSPRKWLPFYVPRLIALIRTRRFDIVHCHLFGANWIAKPLATLCAVPVRINHDQCNDALRHESRFALAMDTFTNRCASHVCAVSRSTREFLLAHENIAEDRVSIVYNAIDLDHFMPPSDRPVRDRFVVLGIGRLHPQKNFTLFLETAQRVIARHPHTEFRLAGTGPEEGMLRAKASELGLDHCVQFLGHVRDTRALYADADALLMTSRYEGTPLTMLEAMAMRLPIVATAIDGIGEILVDGEDALLVAADAERLSAALDRMI